MRAANEPEKVRAERARFYALNPKKVAKYNAAWRAKNPEKYKAQQGKWRSGHLDVVRERTKQYKARLPDTYVASLLGLRVEQIPKELIDLKRVQLQITRHLKEQK